MYRCVLERRFRAGIATKLVCTIGPATSSQENFFRLADAGPILAVVVVAAAAAAAAAAAVALAAAAVALAAAAAAAAAARAPLPPTCCL